MIIKLKKNYDQSFEQFVAYSDMYGIATRLGYKSNATAWKANPTIQVTCDPADLKVIRKKRKKVAHG